MQNTQKPQDKTTKPWDPISPVRTAHMSVLMWLGMQSCSIQYNTHNMIVFLLILQTFVIAQKLSVGGEGVAGFVAAADLRL